jgi:DNA-nicking Smr family endonuclease
LLSLFQFIKIDRIPSFDIRHSTLINSGFAGLGMTSMKVVKLTIEDVLDLHTFRPKDIPDLLEDYFAECLKTGIYSVRIIHGKGKGIQKRRVRGLLEKNSMVTAFKEAPPEAGGWGATLVELSRNLDPEH